MDRFGWCDGLLGPDEQLITTQNGVRIYDGKDKVRVYIILSRLKTSSKTQSSPSLVNANITAIPSAKSIPWREAERIRNPV